MIDWKRGDRLVCVELDDEWVDDGLSPGTLLQLGHIYTIREIGPDEVFGCQSDGSGKIWIDLIEIPLRSDAPIFGTECFRKATEKDTPVAQIRRLCRDAATQNKRTFPVLADTATE